MVSKLLTLTVPHATTEVDDMGMMKLKDWTVPALPSMPLGRVQLRQSDQTKGGNRSARQLARAEADQESFFALEEGKGYFRGGLLPILSVISARAGSSYMRKC